MASRHSAKRSASYDYRRNHEPFKIPDRTPKRSATERAYHSPYRRSSTHRHHIEEQPPSPIETSRCASCTRQCCCRVFLITFVTIGFVLAIVGIVLVLKHHSIFIHFLIKELPIVRGSQTFDLLKDPPGDSVTRFIFFNLTNADNVEKYGARPSFQEVSLAYKVTEKRDNFKFNSDETLVSYSRRKYYHFDYTKSNIREDGEIVTLDFVAYVGLLSGEQRGMGSLAASLLRSKKRHLPFRKHKAGQLLWGSEDSLYDSLLGMAVTMGEVDTSSELPDKFGFLYGKNGSLVQNYTIYTGKGDISKYQKLKTYNDQDERLDDVWPDEGITDDTGMPYNANLFRGTLGYAFYPDVGKHDKLNAFVSEMCLSMEMDYLGIDNIGDIDMFTFGVNHRLFKTISDQINHELCAPEDRNSPDRCPSYGVLNSSSCYNGLPVIMSWPHFFEADPYYLELVEGLSPRDNSHAPAIDVEPLTGATVKVAQRGQVNFPLLALPHDGYDKLPKFTLFPVFWMDQSGQIDKKNIERLKDLIYSRFYALRTLAYGLLIASVILVPVGVIVFFVYQCHGIGRCFRI